MLSHSSVESNFSLIQQPSKTAKSLRSFSFLVRLRRVLSARTFGARESVLHVERSFGEREAPQDLFARQREPGHSRQAPVFVYSTMTLITLLRVQSLGLWGFQGDFVFIIYFAIAMSGTREFCDFVGSSLFILFSVL